MKKLAIVLALIASIATTGLVSAASGTVIRKYVIQPRCIMLGQNKRICSSSSYVVIVRNTADSTSACYVSAATYRATRIGAKMVC